MAVAEALRLEFPKLYCAVSSTGENNVLLPRAVDSYWRSLELPEGEEEPEGYGRSQVEEGIVGGREALRAERLLLYLRGQPNDSLLEVRESRIPGAGRGLFVTRDVPPGEWLAVYTGTPLSLAEVMRRKEKGELSDYVRGGFGLFSLDAVDYQAVLARYINDPYLTPERRNVRFLKLRKAKRALVLATRKVSAGEELYAKYGDGYWRARGLLPPVENK